MSEHEDLELEALQRQLDDAFETTRPRRGFEDELWLRMQARRPVWTRLRDGLAAFVDGLREAPAVPAAAVAVVLVVAVGVGVLTLGGGLHLGERSTAASGAYAPHGGGPDLASGGASRLPTPVLHPGLVDASAPALNPGGLPVAAGPASPMNVYFGPANLHWTGTFGTTQDQAPVFRYLEPAGEQARAATADFGSSVGVTVTTRGSVSQLPREPIYVLTETIAGVAPGTDPTFAATTFLSDHNVSPTWFSSVVVTQSGGVTRVVFERTFPLDSGHLAYLVDWNGDRYGAEVDIVNGRRTATGPLSLSLDAVQYRLISNDQAAQAALSQAPADQRALQPVPDVNLDSVELVYALAVSGGQGFYEPAYLFSGSFQYNGQTYVKRVLVPLVDPSLRS